MSIKKKLVHIMDYYKRKNVSKNKYSNKKINPRFLIQDKDIKNKFYGKKHKAAEEIRKKLFKSKPLKKKKKVRKIRVQSTLDIASILKKKFTSKQKLKSIHKFPNILVKMKYLDNLSKNKKKIKATGNKKQIKINRQSNKQKKSSLIDKRKIQTNFLKFLKISQNLLSKVLRKKYIYLYNNPKLCKKIISKLLTKLLNKINRKYKKISKLPFYDKFLKKIKSKKSKHFLKKSVPLFLKLPNSIFIKIYKQVIYKNIYRLKNTDISKKVKNILNNNLNVLSTKKDFFFKTKFSRNDNKKRLSFLKNENLDKSYLSKINNFSILKKNKHKLSINEIKKNRFNNRCVLTGRSKSVYKQFKLSRIELRRLVNLNEINGVFRITW
jgi:ribosomal protein S14